MMTRKACDMEAKLSKALLELQKSRVQCNELLQEREDSEVEIIQLNKKISCLKSQLVDADIQIEDIQSQCDQLKKVVNSYDHCRDTHEAALTRVKDLEISLNNAHLELYELRQQNCNNVHRNTVSLYEELVDSKEPLETIDLTDSVSCDLVVPKDVSSRIRGTNKIKKYVKLNKFIKKTKLNLKLHKKIINTIPKRLEKISLIEKLQSCQDELHVMTIESDTLQRELKLITNKYELASRQMSEYVCAMNKIIDLGTDNLQRFESLTESNNIACTQCNSSIQTNKHTPSPNIINRRDSVSQGPLKSTESTRRTIVYSDQLGLGLGRLMNECLNHQIINNCYPGATYQHIINQIKNTTFNKYTTLIIYVGNSFGMRKKDILDCIDTLNKINENGIEKIILCALPYSNRLTSQQNKQIGYYNNLFYTLTWNIQGILFFDTNKFIKNFVLTKDTMYLPKYNNITIAKLLAYNINDLVMHITRSNNIPNKICSLSTNNIQLLNTRL
ncbi:outer dense fiber protein 2-like [Aphomia sociella]